MAKLHLVDGVVLVEIELAQAARVLLIHLYHLCSPRRRKHQQQRGRRASSSEQCERVETNVNASHVQLLADGGSHGVRWLLAFWKLEPTTVIGIAMMSTPSIIVAIASILPPLVTG